MAGGARSIGDADDGEPADGVQRIDKWLWYARVMKSRSQAAELVRDGGVRLNRDKVDKPSHTVRAGDVLTVTAHSRVRILKVKAPGTRRGPAPEALLLYDDLTPLPTPGEATGASASRSSGRRDPGSGRPTKRERRDTDWLKGAK